jgi:hypothetical protein
VWIQRPDRIREETEGFALTNTRAVWVGQRWSLWDEHNGIRTNQGEEDVRGGDLQYAAWLEPASLLGDLRFDPPVEALDCGRAAFRTTARIPDFAGLGEDEEERFNWDLHGLGGLTDDSNHDPKHRDDRHELIVRFM